MNPEPAHAVEPGVLAIVYDGRSGSVLVQSLLDGHPAVLTTPRQILHGYLGTFWSVAQSRLGAGVSADQLGRLFVETYPELFDGHAGDGPRFALDKLGEGENEPVAVDIGRFLTELAERLPHAPVTRRAFFLALHHAYATARGEAGGGKSLIVYPLHDPAGKNVDDFRADFPGAKILVTTRQPGATYASFYKFWVAEDPTLPGSPWHLDVYHRPSSAYYTLRMALTRGAGEPLADGAHVRVLPLEDLHADSRATMLRLAAWAGIPFHPTLLESTINGRPFTFETPNRAGGKASGFNPGMARERGWVKDWYRHDLLLLEYLVHHRFAAYGWEPATPQTGGLSTLAAAALVLLPRRMEVDTLRRFLTPGPLAGMLGRWFAARRIFLACALELAGWIFHRPLFYAWRARALAVHGTPHPELPGSTAAFLAALPLLIALPYAVFLVRVLQRMALEAHALARLATRGRPRPHERL